MNKDIRNLLLITVAFAVVIGGFLSQASFDFGAPGVEHLFTALVWFAAWLFIVVVYLAWMFARSRTRYAGVAAIGIVSAAALALVIFKLLEYREEVLCAEAYDFYRILAAAEPPERMAMIAGGGEHVRDPSYCAQDSLRAFFKLEPAAPDTGRSPISEKARIEVLAALFAAGLPPSDQMLRDVMNDADVAGLRLLLAARKKAGITTFPAYVAGQAAYGANCKGEDRVGRAGKLHAHGKKARKVLEMLFAAATPPPPDAFLEHTQKSLRCLGLMAK